MSFEDIAFVVLTSIRSLHTCNSSDIAIIVIMDTKDSR